MMLEQGLEDTFHEAVGANTRKWVGWVYRRLGPRGSWQDAEDIVQDGLSYFWRRGLRRYQPSRASMATFIWGPIRWSLLAWLEGRQLELELPAEVRDSHRLEDEVIARADLADALEKLSPRAREAFRLCKVDGHSCEEAALLSRWPCKPSTMKLRAHRARIKLRADLGEPRGRARPRKGVRSEAP